MVKHIVAWNFEDGFTDNENLHNAEKMKYELENLKNFIPEIIDMKVNIHLSTTSNRKVLLYSLFKSDEDLLIYQIHPEHKRVSEFVGTVMKDRVCLDFHE